MLERLPHNFVFLSDVDPSIIESVRYYTTQNFLGRRVKGYRIHKIVCTHEAATQLKTAHDYFKEHGYKLVVYDGYRPQIAVDEFKSWGADLQDLSAKASYYPTLPKKDLFSLGYLPEETSMHSRGSAFDLSLMKTEASLKSIVQSKRILNNGEAIPFLDDNTIDMGSSFDLFHEASHHDSPLVQTIHREMRDFLAHGLKLFGFQDYKNEWWHYHLKNEPYPNTYFDFIVEKGI